MNERDESWVLDELEDLYTSSRDAGRTTAAIRALELIGRHRGMFRVGVEETRELPRVIIVEDLKDI